MLAERLPPIHRWQQSRFRICTGHIQAVYTSYTSCTQVANNMPSRRVLGDWLGVVPFFLFAVAFIFWPAMALFVGAFRDAQGGFTLANIVALFQPFILDAYWLTIRVSLVTAVGGGIFGFLVAYAAILGGLPRVRTALTTFSGVASNFAAFRWPSPLSLRWGGWGW